jgi:hypothetical protein
LIGVMLAASLVIAGCAAPVPEGTVVADQEAFSEVTVGNVTVNYTAFHSPANDTAGGVPGTVGGATGQDVECAGDDAPAGDEYKCTHPSTAVMVGFPGLPEPGTSTYSAWFVGPEGELEIGPLVFNEHGMHESPPQPTWGVNVTFQGENLDGMYESIEVRLGSQPVVRAPASAGTNAFAIVPELASVTATLSWVGMELTASVDGLPEGAEATAWLVVMDPIQGELVHETEFPVGNGTATATAPRPIAEYAEFHVHLGDSKINLATTALGG